MLDQVRGRKCRGCWKVGGIVEAGVNTRRGADKLALRGMIIVSYGAGTRVA